MRTVPYVQFRIQAIDRMLQHRAKYITLAAAIGIQLISLASTSHAQELSDSSLTKLFDEMESERAKLQRFIVKCSFRSEGIPDYPSGLKMTYEFSKPDDHYVIVYDYSNCANEHRRPNTWHGRSGGYYISGTQGRDSILGAWKPNSVPYRSKSHFDLMALGFGFLGDLRQGTSLPRLTENLTRASDSLGLKVSGDGDLALITASKYPKPRIVIDRARACWPIKSDLAHAIWKLKLEEIGETYAPTWFEFTSLDERRQPNGRLTAVLDWKYVNAKFTVGREAAVRIATDNGSNLVD